MCTRTDYSTPSSVVTLTHTRTISETDTSSYTKSYQPSSVIWSTYTSVDVINSVTHTTTKQITTKQTTKYTATRTTALSTTTTTTTTMTTTKANGNFKKRVDISGPQPVTVTPSETPGYAATCYRVPRYVYNCIDLGATHSVTTIVPAIDSEVLSSTSVSTASGDTSVYVSSTITQTTTTTLPSLHSTKTVSSTTTDVISTSTSTTYTKTTTHTSTGIKTSTLGTTTTTTTLSTASPTPYLIKVTSEIGGGGAPSETTNYIDWVTTANQNALKNSFTYGSYALGFVGSSVDGDLFVITPEGYLATIISTGSGKNKVNKQYLLTVVGGYVIPDASPAAGAAIITCTLNPGSGGKATLSDCNYNIFATTWSSNGGSLNIVGATTDSDVAGQLTVQLSASTY